jgi:hypothetical protein
MLFVAQIKQKQRNLFHDFLALSLAPTANWFGIFINVAARGMARRASGVILTDGGEVPDEDSGCIWIAARKVVTRQTSFCLMKRWRAVTFELKILTNPPRLVHKVPRAEQENLRAKLSAHVRSAKGIKSSQARLRPRTTRNSAINILAFEMRSLFGALQVVQKLFGETSKHDN